ncbi:MAG: multifunctional oxoglutarate decarboxylase/oxoglutarate dehydrogenase thiamine pyrophosphate-binding subunit/dihydrolipoyllysine-residue succinyltransferase subunit [Candidatus Eremiobacteraeota bacterium]|nr:multifunctional oxoglutarate decarboxylase/oxoglutarate dehydrogenase thiamine pyrophosphate-binding subunit/dihydrolipoyllysine-residue succinyltransferase subunit [Candidatus Eremiobacteraeota bacterium]
MPETIVRVTLPEMGESVTEGSIVEWRVKPGQWIEEGATLVDVTTDKVDVEVPSPSAGLVKSVLAAEGATVAVGAPLAEIDTSAEKPAAGAASPAASQPVLEPVANGAAKPPPPNGAAPTGGAVSYRARRLAERDHLDVASISGSGPEGLVVRDDVQRAAAAGSPRPASTASAAAPPAPLAPDAKPVPLKGPAASLVGYMEASLTIPTATSFRTLQVGVLERKRAELNAGLKAAGRSEKISYTHVIAYAIVRAADRDRAIVTSFRREGDAPFKVENGVHLGLAVDAQRKDGSRFLIVPVLKDAAALDFAAFRARYEELVAKARDNKLAADDLTGASITLTNPGGIGTVASVPRLMPGQAAIVAAGAIGYPPGFALANEAALRQLGVEKTMTLTSTYDHRVIQGAQSGEFLKRVDELLGGGERFYDDIFASLGVAAGRTDGARSAASAPVAVTDAGPREPREVEAYSDELLRAVAAGMALVSAYRRHGHLAATLDPLGAQPPGDPSLDAHAYGLTPSIMSAVPAAILRTKLKGSTLAETVGELRRAYSSTIAYEVEHIANIEQREWLRDYIESGRHVAPLSAERARKVLDRLTKVETFERYLRKTYLGAKTFSIEGLDVMIPMLEQLVTEFADDGIGTAVLGMAHRGRLATISHVVNRPYDEILAEFDAADRRGEGGDDDVTGDVKYHHGAEGTYVTLDGHEIAVALASNPSHLEAVDGVVEGRTRALQTRQDTPQAALDLRRAAPILIHGDAAFSAQGVVAEVLNLQALAGYATGGTIHFIANNQVGFTTDPRDARSTRYASDLAKGFDVPIVHVNADDVEACMAAVQLAVDFRRRFGRDAIIDAIGYRRFGHNEADEPAYTQPDMYERIKAHPTVRELYAQKLMAQGVVTADDVNAMLASASARISEAHKNVKAGKGQTGAATVAPTASGVALGGLDTSVPKDKLLAWNADLLKLPEGFSAHPKLLRQLERRREGFVKEGEADWGLSEALSFASLLSEGTPIRLTGQDTQRGTFSHRHLVLHDPKSNATYAPIQHLPTSLSSFEVYNSPLSEYACLGFEYGYSVETPNALVLWEAQFGDFMNGAQIIIDQFIAAGQAKWDERSRLVLLLPHGYEGAGPEHSSARIERFLQLSAEGNVQVANCSNATQYFHLLRHQARNPKALPLVIFTPKSLLRMKAAGGALEAMASGRFQPVINDEKFANDREKVERFIMCSGKVYYDLVGHEDYAKMTATAIVRIELLSPLPTEAILSVLASYPNLKRLVWVQEEPKNMGPRAHVRRRLLERLPKEFGDVAYVGRPYRASPSEGYGGAHAVEQERIVKEALTE